jgi:hypothetical protein
MGSGRTRSALKSLRWVVPLAAAAGLLQACWGGQHACPAIYGSPQLWVQPPLSPGSDAYLAPGSLTIATTSEEFLNGCDRWTAKGISFYANEVLIGTDDAAPFAVTWEMVPGTAPVPAVGEEAPVTLSYEADRGTYAGPPVTVRIRCVAPQAPSGEALGEVP